jgi:hypothetical protein
VSVGVCEGEWQECSVTGKLRFYQCARAVLLKEPLPPDAGEDVGLALCLKCMPPDRPPPPGEPADPPAKWEEAA